MVGDYISRDEMVEQTKARSVLGAPKYNTGLETAIEVATSIPAADVVERKPGVWIWDDEGYHCSECFFHAYGSTAEILSGDYHFCPHCGAAMDGGQGDV